jgi:hypothetical protein
MTRDEAVVKLTILLPAMSAGDVEGFMVSPPDLQVLMLKTYADAQQVPARSVADVFIDVAKECVALLPVGITIEQFIAGLATL